MKRNRKTTGLRAPHLLARAWVRWSLLLGALVLLVTATLAAVSWVPWPGAEEPVLIRLAAPPFFMHFSLPGPGRTKARALCEQALTRVLAENPPAGRDLLLQALSRDPSLAKAWSALGRIQSELQLAPQAAIVPYARAMLLDPRGHVRAGGDLARILAEVGAGEDAMAVGEYVLRLAPGDPEASIGIAIHREREKDLGGAESVLRASLPGNPDHADLLLTLSRVLVKQHRNEEAAGHLEHAADLDPFNESVRCLLALSLAEMGRTLDAEVEGSICSTRERARKEAYRVAYAAGGEVTAESAHGATRILLDAGLAATPTRYLLEALRSGVPMEEIGWEMARVALRLGRIEDAARALRGTPANEANRWEILVVRADLVTAQSGTNTTSEAICSLPASVAPPDGRIHARCAIAHLREGHGERARAAVEVCLGLPDPDGSCHRAAGLVAEWAGDIPRAREFLGQAAALAPFDSAIALDHARVSRAGTAPASDALPIASRAWRLERRDPKAAQIYAETLRAAGQAEDATRLDERAREIEASGPPPLDGGLQ